MDRKVCAHHLESSGKEATLSQLLECVNTEMKSRMRAMAPLRNSGQPSRHPISHFRLKLSNFKTGLPHKCCLCQNSSHWIDQCKKFALLNPENWIKTVKENHACFSCLKCAKRDHRSSNCSRRANVLTKAVEVRARITITRSYMEQFSRPSRLLSL